jgi:two-component system, OmpR family, alkaline phosphatase synthesis response regulator PhoP
MDLENPSVSPGETYDVACFSCQASFDVLAGPWCSCLVGKRTFVCPACGSCFCKATAAYKQWLWEKAPQSLWDRVIQERGKNRDLPANPPVESVQRPLVLVVDDEPDILRASLAALKEFGYGAVIARDGMEGLDLARRYEPDLVLADAFMPRLDGREMCRRLKSDPALSGVKVVIMTAVYTAARYRSEAFHQFHADDYLSKPLEFRDLRSTLAKHLTAPSHR